MGGFLPEKPRPFDDDRISWWCPSLSRASEVITREDAHDRLTATHRNASVAVSFGGF